MITEQGQVGEADSREAMAKSATLLLTCINYYLLSTLGRKQGTRWQFKPIFILLKKWIFYVLPVHKQRDTVYSYSMGKRPRCLIIIEEERKEILRPELPNISDADTFNNRNNRHIVAPNPQHSFCSHHCLHYADITASPYYLIETIMAARGLAIFWGSTAIVLVWLPAVISPWKMLCIPPAII